MPRIRKKSKPKRRIFMTLFNILMVTLILSLIIGAGVVYYIVQDSIAKLPEIDPENVILDQNSVILDADGNLLSRVYGNSLRTVIDYDEISQDAINAFIAVEDKTFWEHSGFNYVRMIGAVKEALLSHDSVSGTSTITQQLARNLFLTDTRLDYSPVRKIQEAYYSMIIEDTLEKEKILETYLNTIFLGASAEGIEAAATIYFNKTASELDYIEGAMLAALPQAPTDFAPMFSVERNNISADDIVVGERDSQYLYVYNPYIEHRYQFILELMLEQGYINEAQYQVGMETNPKDKLNPGKFYNDNISSFFVETVQNQVIEDMVNEKGISVEQANNLLLTSGYTIHSTLVEGEQQFLQRQYMEEGSSEYFNSGLTSTLSQFQRYHDIYDDGVLGEESWNILIEKGYFSSSISKPILSEGDEHRYIADVKKALAQEGFAINHPWISDVRPTFSNGRIVLSDGYLYDYKASFDSEKNFLLPSYYFYQTESGDIRIEKNGLLKFQKTDSGYIYLGLGDMYHFGTNPQDRDYKYDGTYQLNYFLLFENGSLSFPNDYLSVSDEELVIDSAAFDDGVIWLNEYDELVIDAQYVNTSTMPSVQPQSAAVMIDEYTGQLKAIFGGRGVIGRYLYNRATSPHQTGSSIKPIAIYGPGIDSGRITAATVAIDKPSYEFNPSSNEPWPVNFDGQFHGPMTVRNAIRISQNVPAVTFGSMIGVDIMADYLEANGITSLEREGSYNDMNLSSLCLGALTYGISPIEMASAYGTFGNEGVHMPWIAYTYVEDDKGNIILDRRDDGGTRVFSEEANYIMTDLLNDVVTNFADPAIIGGGIPVIGKTGTTGATRENTDAWFVGVTPYVATSVWVGTDRNISLQEGSFQVAAFWGHMMKSYHSDLPSRSFAEKPDGVGWITVDARSGKLPGKYTKSTITELYILGTAPSEVDDSYELHEVCAESGKAPTEFCKDLVEEVFLKASHAFTASDRAQVFDPDDTCDIHTEEEKEEEEEEDEKKDDDDKDKDESKPESNPQGRILGELLLARVESLSKTIRTTSTKRVAQSYLNN
ncbi:MAG: hypothetical protein GX079_05505 [Tissierellia bacterium]|nr:hypothetical protein [Tissierellia bacterium]